MKDVLIDNIVSKFYNEKNKMYNIKDIDKKTLKQLYIFNRAFSKILDSYLNKTELKMHSDAKKEIFKKLDEHKVILNELNTIIKNNTKKVSYVKDESNNVIQTGGFVFSDPNASFFTKILDFVQLVLDVAGFIPGAGIPIDATGVVLSISRQDWSGALLSAINMIPLIGSFIGTPTKYVKKYKKLKKIERLMHARDMYDDYYD